MAFFDVLLNDSLCLLRIRMMVYERNMDLTHGYFLSVTFPVLGIQHGQKEHSDCFVLIGDSDKCPKLALFVFAICVYMHMVCCICVQRATW